MHIRKLSIETKKRRRWTKQNRNHVWISRRWKPKWKETRTMNGLWVCSSSYELMNKMERMRKKNQKSMFYHSIVTKHWLEMICIHYKKMCTHTHSNTCNVGWLVGRSVELLNIVRSVKRNNDKMLCIDRLVSLKKPSI